MITYEVTVVVREELRTRFEMYMRDRHIPEVLATGLFAGAQFLRGDGGRYRSRYLFADRASHDRYLETHAARLRADFGSHLPEGVTVSREVWDVLADWPP